MASQYDIDRAAHNFMEGSLNVSTDKLPPVVTPLFVNYAQTGYRFGYDSHLEAYTVTEWSPEIVDGMATDVWETSTLADWLSDIAIMNSVETNLDEIDKLAEQLIEKIDDLGVVH